MYVETMTLIKQSNYSLRTTERAIERKSVLITQRDRGRNEELRRTGITDVMKRVAQLKNGNGLNMLSQLQDRTTTKITKRRLKQAKKPQER